MKRFCVKLAVFLFLLLGILALLEAGFRHKPNIFKDKFNGLSSNADKVEVLFLGHSHTDEGIDPKVMEHVGYNMGFGYQNVYFDCYLLKHFIDRMTSLKCVVISASFIHIYDPLPDLKDLNGENLFNTIKYHLYCELDSVKQDRIPILDPKYNLEIFNNPPRAYIENFKYYLGKRPQGDGNVTVSEDYLNKDGEYYASAHFGKEDRPYSKPHNYYIYKEMAQICQSRNIPFVLVLFPSWHTYLDNVPNNQVEVTNYLLSELTKECSNCTVLDYSRDGRFDSSEFRDANHLNRKGAAKMTRILENQLFTAD